MIVNNSTPGFKLFTNKSFKLFWLVFMKCYVFKKIKVLNKSVFRVDSRTLEFKKRSWPTLSQAYYSFCWVRRFHQLLNTPSGYTLHNGRAVRYHEPPLHRGSIARLTKQVRGSPGQVEGSLAGQPFCQSGVDHRAEEVQTLSRYSLQ